MSLTNFFRINLPYGLKKNESDEWFAFNREYLPLGWNTTDGQERIHDDKPYSQYPLHTQYKGLTEDAIQQIIKNPDAIKRGKDGKITFIFFYYDGTYPQASPEAWNDYFDIIKAFSKFEISKK